MLRILALCFLPTAPLAAETHISDAFGILPISELSAERAAWAGLRDGAETVFTRAGEADALLIFIGPKALVAGAEDGHAVALAFDQHGNLAQGAEAVFSLETNGLQSDLVLDGIADTLFRPDPLAGTFAGGASIGDLQSPRALYRVTADLESVVPVIEHTSLLRAETFATIRSTELTDRHGNLVEDGTGTTVLLTHDDGTTTVLATPVKEARSEASILVRDIASGGKLHLELGTSTATEAVEYSATERGSPTDLHVWALQEIGAVGLRLGPVTTAAGHLMTDGSPVQVSISVPGDTVQTRGWLRDGYFQTVLRHPGRASKLTATFRTALGEETRVISVGVNAPARIRGVE